MGSSVKRKVSKRVLRSVCSSSYQRCHSRSRRLIFKADGPAPALV